VLSEAALCFILLGSVVPLLASVLTSNSASVEFSWWFDYEVGFLLDLKSFMLKS